MQRNNSIYIRNQYGDFFLLKINISHSIYEYHSLIQHKRVLSNDNN